MQSEKTAFLSEDTAVNNIEEIPSQACSQYNFITKYTKCKLLQVTSLCLFGIHE